MKKLSERKCNKRSKETKKRKTLMEILNVKSHWEGTILIFFSCHLHKYFNVNVTFNLRFNHAITFPFNCNFTNLKGYLFLKPILITVIL